MGLRIYNNLQVTLDVEMSVVLVKDGVNQNNESLAVGTDIDGTKKRFLIKFNLDALNKGTRLTLAKTQVEILTSWNCVD